MAPCRSAGKFQFFLVPSRSKNSISYLFFMIAMISTYLLRKFITSYCSIYYLLCFGMRYDIKIAIVTSGMILARRDGFAPTSVKVGDAPHGRGKGNLAG